MPEDGWMNGCMDRQTLGNRIFCLIQLHAKGLKSLVESMIELNSIVATVLNSYI